MVVDNRRQLSAAFVPHYRTELVYDALQFFIMKLELKAVADHDAKVLVLFDKRDAIYLFNY